MVALAALFGSSVEMKGILEMPFNTVQCVRKCKASWRCHPLTDSRTERHDEVPNSSLLFKKLEFLYTMMLRMKKHRFWIAFRRCLVLGMIGLMGIAVGLPLMGQEDLPIVPQNKKRTVKKTQTKKKGKTSLRELSKQKGVNQAPQPKTTATPKQNTQKPPSSRQNKAQNTPKKTKTTQTPPPTPTAQKTGGKPKKNTGIQEEIQRYLGYESPLLFRYLSLPYDVSINTTVRGWHVIVGFWLLLFVPIILLLGFYNRPIYGVFTMLACLLLLVVSTANSPIIGTEFESIPAQSAQLTEYLHTTAFSDAPTGVLMAYVYKAFLPIYQLLEAMISPLSGETDAITYPILIALFIGFFFLLHYRLREKSVMIQSLVVAVYLYFFLWYLLAGGIVWYGYLVLPLGILITVFALTRVGELSNRPKWLMPFVLGMGFVSLSFGVVQRISNINQLENPLQLNEKTGQYMLDWALVKYQRGEFKEKQAFNTYFRNINKALREINKEDKSLIYRAGTPFSFFIRKNDKRVFNDNLLQLFQQLVSHYKTQEEVTNALKAANFKYVIVDLNAASFDQTAESSVKKKFNVFMAFLKQNPNLELLATNRLVKGAGTNAQNQTIYEVFGEVLQPGSYAIYKIKD